MAVQTDRSRSADAGDGSAAGSAMDLGRVLGALRAHGAPPGGPGFTRGRFSRRIGLYEFLTYGPLIRLVSQDAAAAHHLRQHDRPGHPAGRHLLPRPVPRLADRGEARQPARAGRDHRRRHRRQRNARKETGASCLDPDRLPEIEGARSLFRDEDSRRMQLSIAPERVAPLFGGCCRPTSARASMARTAS